MTAEPWVQHARAPHTVGRACAATVVALLGAAGAHTWAGGTLPTLPGLAVVAGVLMGSGLLLFSRRVPTWSLLPLVALAQLGLHESFGLVGSHSHAAHVGQGGVAAAVETGWTWQMVAAHGFVTLLTAVLWWAGQRLATWVVWFRERVACPPHGAPRPRPATTWVAPAHAHVLVSPRRGPPTAYACT